MSMFKSVSRVASSRAATTASTATEALQRRLCLDQLFPAKDGVEQDTLSGADVSSGLSQACKTLPSRYFYNDRGSDLFEQICTLPEYYPTRTETAILRTCALEIAATTGACELVELGSGSATKTRILLDAYSKLHDSLHYMPIDVSGGMLEGSALKLLSSYPTLWVRGLVGTYESALQQLPPTPLPARMICFLGSTLGNLNPRECKHFFRQITAALESGEYFLLGVDLQKSQEQLEAAYNDSLGITAEFNLNMLDHLNQRFSGNFDLAQFKHLAFYNPAQNQIEMHLKSLKDQAMRLEALDLDVALTSGETILTEISRKFNLSSIQQELETEGLVPIRVWTDPNRWFGLLLCQLQ